MKFFVLTGLAMASAVCMGQTTIPGTEKALDRQPGSSERAPAQTPTKIGYGEALPSPLDNQLVWDQFKHRGTLVWACRGATTGQFVAASYCASQPMVDSRWPDKKTPEGYSGVLSFD
ncbi:hypothetical protein [Pseudoduganella buxea]|uniref:Uncharacterized protein n=1 Tax=Pseudoduganella buxea TaxID=1949069 RepID=A0A6I3T259_9BURK|nr:hypothetical protein [Pseudoduganella buxea]MTV54562.1 hypothetical protein [Pseudoduganella buxea]GGB83190.1 hypothetical protein GCM10011572_01390 [Pseudoduganella buxea]